MRLTKIIATIGPACDSEDMLRQMIQGGLDVARLNFSHGSYEEHLHILKDLRRLSEEMQRPVAIMQDLCGPKIRVGEMRTDCVELQAGSFLRITKESVEGDANCISCTYPTSSTTWSRVTGYLSMTAS
jgi:pyruvate kinase